MKKNFFIFFLILISRYYILPSYSATLTDIKSYTSKKEYIISFYFDSKIDYRFSVKTNSIHSELQINNVTLKKRDLLDKIEIPKKYIINNEVNFDQDKFQINISLIYEIGTVVNIDKMFINKKNVYTLNIHFLNLIDKEKKFIPKSKIKQIKDENKKIIVIDAGHGGTDPGAVGINMTREKDITIEYALTLYDIFLHDTYFYPVLTRDTDYYLPLWERNRISQENQADLFISIHCNAHTSRSWSGTNVYYYLDEKKVDTDATMVANIENKIFYENEEKYSIFFKSQTDLNYLFWELKRAFIIKESAKLTSIILEKLNELNDIAINESIHHAEFIVLKNLVVPSVLLETGFITNEQDNKLLISNEFKVKYCNKIYEAVKKYFRF